MTKQMLREEMTALICHYHDRADRAESEVERRSLLDRIAGIETLATRLKIKLWS